MSQPVLCRGPADHQHNQNDDGGDDDECDEHDARFLERSFYQASR